MEMKLGYGGGWGLGSMGRGFFKMSRLCAGGSCERRCSRSCVGLVFIGFGSGTWNGIRKLQAIQIFPLIIKFLNVLNTKPLQKPIEDNPFPPHWPQNRCLSQQKIKFVILIIILKKMIKNLSEKQLGHAFFFALKIDDYEHAYYLLKLGTPINTSYFINQDELVYTINLVVSKTAQVVKKYGSSHSKSQLMLRILDICLEQKPDLRCHCTVKNPHYCALSQAFRHIKFQSESDLFIQDNLLILKLLFNGASYRNLTNSKQYKWVGINTLNAYIATKKADVIQLLKTNRHAKFCARNTNRHWKCAVGEKIGVCEL